MASGTALTYTLSLHDALPILFSDVLMPGEMDGFGLARWVRAHRPQVQVILTSTIDRSAERSEEHPSELQSQSNLVCRLLLEKKKATSLLAPWGIVRRRWIALP